MSRIWSLAEDGYEQASIQHHSIRDLECDHSWLCAQGTICKLFWDTSFETIQGCPTMLDNVGCPTRDSLGFTCIQWGGLGYRLMHWYLDLYLDLFCQIFYLSRIWTTCARHDLPFSAGWPALIGWTKRMIMSSWTNATQILHSSATSISPLCKVIEGSSLALPVAFPKRQDSSLHTHLQAPLCEDLIH